MRISDWSSDVCSSDLNIRAAAFGKVCSPPAHLSPFRSCSAATAPTVHPRRRAVRQYLLASRLSDTVPVGARRVGRQRVDALPLNHVQPAHPEMRGLCPQHRPEERREGQECVSTRIYRWSPSRSKTNKPTHNHMSKT